MVTLYLFLPLHFIAFRRMIIFNYDKGAGLSEKGMTYDKKIGMHETRPELPI
jgi:hypothetical protein